MFKKFLIAILFVAGITGCNSKSAYNYSEKIVAMEKSLLPDIEKTESSVEKFVKAEQYDSIAAAGARMEGLVEKKIKEIESMSVPKAKEAASFKEATLNYFKYIKKMYTGYKEWGNAATDEEREEKLSEIMEFLEGKQKAIDDMQKVQRKFADANGFKVQ
jgi:esterase/lipase